MSQDVTNAVIITLTVHAVALLALTQFTTLDSTPNAEYYAEVEIIDPDLLPDIDELMDSQVDPIQERIQERIANLRADASKESSSKSRSTGITAAEQAAIDKAVEKELSALEQSEMDRLSAQEKKFNTVGLPEEGNNERVDTMDDWDKQYEGRVTVRFDLESRSAQHLDVPGYKCKGRADIVVNIVVNSDGDVVSADLVSGAEAHSCFVKAALKSAESSRFLPSSSAPRRQIGTISYAFVAQ